VIKIVNLILGAGPILLAIVIALTEAMKWPKWLNYVWAGVALLFGIFILLL